MTQANTMKTLVMDESEIERALTRMAGRTFPESALPDPFCLTFSGRNIPPRGEYE